MVVTIKTGNSHKTYSDEEIIQLFIQTQQNVFFEELYERYANRVYSKCLSFVKDPAQAEDFTHDIFLKLIVRLGSYKGDARFSTWLYSITYNYCMDQLRIHQKRREVHADESLEIPHEADLTYLMDEQDIELRRLRQAMERLSAEERTVLMMKYQDNLSVREMAVIFRSTESAVKMRLLRTRDKLRTRYLETLLFWGLFLTKALELLKFVRLPKI